MSVKEKFIYTGMAVAVLFALGYIFYRSAALSALLCCFAVFYPKVRTAGIIRKRKNELNIQFKDMLYALSSSLGAGKSIESAFKDAWKDLAILYPDPETSIIREIEHILRRIEMNEPIEAALAEFACRSHLEDVHNFADVIHTCKRTGGNLIEVIKNTSNIINDKIEIKQEIDTLLSERKLEQKVLNAMPVFLILVLSASAGDYIGPVFSTMAGRTVMTVSMLLLAGAYFLSKEIMDIKV